MSSCEMAVHIHRMIAQVYVCKSWGKHMRKYWDKLGFNEDNNVGRTKTINHPDWEWDFHTTKKMVMTGGWLITTRKKSWRTHSKMVI